MSSADIGMEKCAYCGYHHNYSAEMCKDIMSCGASAAQRIDLVDVGKLQGEIADLRRKLEDAQLELGEMKESLHQSNIQVSLVEGKCEDLTRTVDDTMQELHETQTRAHAVTLDNARLRKTLNIIECETDDPDAAGWARTALAAPADALGERVQVVLMHASKAFHYMLPTGEVSSIGDEVDALLREIGGKA